MTEPSPFDKLALDVYEMIGVPINTNVVRATLESMSIRNSDASNTYGSADLQALSHKLFVAMTDESFVGLHPSPAEVDAQFKMPAYSARDFFKLKLSDFSIYYPLGLFHGLPVFLQIATIIFFGYSMWTWVGFNPLQSTAVVLGVIFGLVGTGGFVQVIGRQVSHYWFNHDFAMAKKSTIMVFRDALIFMGTLCLLLLILDFFANFYPYTFLFLVFAYAFSIGILLLLSAVFHPLKERWAITLAFVVAASLSLYLKLYTTIDTYFTHWIGIWTANALLLGYLVWFFRNKVQKTKVYNRATTKSAVMIYRNHKFFFYGLFFFIFIFVDRILAWSTTNDGYIPYVVFYEKNYEIGMDIAIVIFFLLVGVLEYGISSFSKITDLLQKQMSYQEIDAFNRRGLKMYWEHVTILLIMGVIMSALMYYVIWTRLGYELAFEEPIDALSIKVSLIGGLGYIFVAWGMLNSLYLFTLNKSGKPLNAILVATGVNLLVGLLCSRLISYEYSVIGMLAGSLTYMLLTLKHTLRFFKNLDYYYYAAY